MNAKLESIAVKAAADLTGEKAMTTPKAIETERGEWTSASSAEADELCHARHKRCLGLPDTSGPDAERGTRIHAVMAGETVDLAPDEAECVERLREMEKEAVRLWENGADPASYDVRREQRLWINCDALKHSGKADVVYLDAAGGRALVIDYKTGRSEVTESPRNIQLRDLAVLVAVNHCVAEVTACILQPFTKPLLCTYTQKELVLSLQELEDRISACHNPDAKANPGDRQCKYCKAKGQCPEFLAGSQPLPMLQSPLPTNEQVALSIASLTGPKLGSFLSMVRLAADVAEEETRKRLAEGQSVDGWKLGEPGTKETINDPNTVHARFIEKGGTTEQFIRCINVAKTKLKTALKEATGSKGKALDDALNHMLVGCVEVKVTAGKLERS